MKIGIFGTSTVGRTLSAKLAQLGHDVMAGTRNVADTLARSEPDRPGMPGMPGFGDWQKEHPDVKLGSFAEAAGHGEVLINATSGMASLQVLQMAGDSNLKDKILIDVSNPLDFSHGMPPVLSVCNNDSLGEQIQRTYPAARVVKTLNTVTAPLMVNPGLVANGDHTLFVCGNDAAAKDQVCAWLREWFGWQDIIDIGDISAARAAEMYLPIWLRLWGAQGTGMFNVKVVK